MCIEESTLIKVRLCLWRVLINSFGLQRKELLIYILNGTNCFEGLFIENINKNRIPWGDGPFLELSVFHPLDWGE